MRGRTWSIGRLMTDIAIFATSLAVLHASRPQQVIGDPGVGVLTLPVALILTAGADRAFFGSKSRAFWLGFTATGLLCAVVALVNLHETRKYILRYGPSLVRAREVFIQQHVAAREAELRGIILTPPQVSKWYLLGSLLTETGLGLALGVLVSTGGGVLAAFVAHFARRARLMARGLDQTNGGLQRTGGAGR